MTGGRDWVHKIPSVRTLYRGQMFAITDWRCRGKDMDADAIGTEYEIVVVRRGSFLRRCGVTESLAVAGTVSCWRPGDVYRITHPLREPDHCTAFRIPTADAEAFFDSIAPRFLSERSIGTDAAVLLPAETYLSYRRLLSAVASPDSRVEVEELVLSIIAAALAAGGSRLLPTGRPRAAAYAAQVRAIISARYAEPLSLSDIAAGVGASPYHLSRMVTAVEGQSIHRLLMLARLHAALEHLLDTTEDIASIAFRVGFSSHSHLSAAFKLRYGVRPSEARRALASPLAARVTSPQGWTRFAR